MKITLIVLLCSATAALAYPTNKLLESLMLSELSDQDIAVQDYDSQLKEYLARFMQAGGRCPHVPPACSNPEAVDICWDDDREIIQDPMVMPNQWICRIEVEGTGGRQWVGTGFKVKISPNVGRTVLFTAAHVIRDAPGRYVPLVRIQCPGQAEQQVRRANDVDMYMAQQYLNSKNYEFDYGYITYAGNSNTGFGFQGFIDRPALAGVNLRACGYPSNQDGCKARCVLGVANSPPPDALQYCDAGILTDLAENKVYVDADIDKGESGGPVYDPTLNNYLALGIISLPADRCPEGRNFHRLNAETLHDMFSHMGAGMQINYRVWGTTNKYLHMDGTGLDAANRVGGNAYAAFRDNMHDTFKIFPIKQSSSNQPQDKLVVIRSATQRNIYLRLDGTGVTAKLLRGGGTANCRFGIEDGAMETFHMETEPDGQVAFRSTSFNNVYLRLDHWEVTGPGVHGTVNAQFGKFTLETNHLEAF